MCRMGSIPRIEHILRRIELNPVEAPRARRARPRGRGACRRDRPGKARRAISLICVISGGASALLPLPADSIALAESQEATRNLLARGATIHEINTVRKHTSRIKGGHLAALSFPATMIALILSDVIGDDLDVIGSGPHGRW